jgi:hypothetical protein
MELDAADWLNIIFPHNGFPVNRSPKQTPWHFQRDTFKAAIGLGCVQTSLDPVMPPRDSASVHAGAVSSQS